MADDRSRQIETLPDGRCLPGQRYDWSALRLIGWRDPQSEGTEGYDAWSYFDERGVYLGPDEFDIEPIFARV